MLDFDIIVAYLTERSDSQLFSTVFSGGHCLNELLPPPTSNFMKNRVAF